MTEQYWWYSQVWKPRLRFIARHAIFGFIQLGGAFLMWGLLWLGSASTGDIKSDLIFPIGSVLLVLYAIPSYLITLLVFKASHRSGRLRPWHVFTIGLTQGLALLLSFLTLSYVARYGYAFLRDHIPKSVFNLEYYEILYSLKDHLFFLEIMLAPLVSAAISAWIISIFVREAKMK